MSRRAVRGMMKARQGRIINITSVVGQMGMQVKQTMLPPKQAWRVLVVH